MSLAPLRERLGRIHDLSRAAALLAWDERTMMPPGGAEARAEQLATLARLRHELFASEEVGRLLADARQATDGAGPDSDEAALVRVAGRDWEKARRVPAELRAEMARSAAIAEHAWVEARRRSDFAALLPHLERNVELLRRFADCYEGFEGFAHPYDPLLDEFEPQMSTAEMKRHLGELRDGLVPLVAGLPEAGGGDPPCLQGSFPIAAQRRLLERLLGELPFEEGSWRLDTTAHPFATAIAAGDIRLTARFDEGDLARALFTALHEAGHGLYESGIDPALARTPLARPRSLGLHESQSLLWENLVGRGRPYLAHALPALREAFPESFADVEAEALYRDANRIERSLIRTEADEVTYHLHILVRFELELEIVEERLPLAELPEAWSARYRDYLGVEVPDDARGALQDVHWAAGSIGYFPTYSLGAAIATQLWEAAGRDVPDLEEAIAAGELAPLGAWLRDRVHRHGRKLTVAEVLERVGAGPLSVQPLLARLRTKAEDLAAG